MIKVIAKTFEILNLVARKRKVALAEIALELGENKTTVANILRTLLDLGQLDKDGMNNYMLGSKLLQLAMADHKRNTLSGISQGIARDLSDTIRESVVVAAWDSGERVSIVEANVQQGIMVNPGAFAADMVYDKATGRVLLAMLPEEELQEYVSTHGLPDKNAWPEAVTEKKLRAALAEIRKAGMVTVVTGGGDVQALAVPVTGPDGTGWASVGCYLPLMRFNGTHKDEIINGVKDAGEKMSRRLTLLHG